MLTEEELWFVFDCMPSEQGSSSNSDFITYCGIAVLNWQKRFSKWKQYKELSKKARKNQLREMIEALENKTLVVLPIVGFCRVDTAIENGKQLARELYDIPDFEPEKRYQYFTGPHKLNSNRAFMYANYASMLSLLTSQAACFGRQLDVKYVGMSLDLLPGDHRIGAHQPGLESMKTFIDRSELLSSIWECSAKSQKLNKLGFGYMSEENTPGDILADWFAQSFHAAINRNSFSLMFGRNSESRRKEIAGLVMSWYKLIKRNEVLGLFKPIVMPRLEGYSGNAFDFEGNQKTE